MVSKQSLSSKTSKVFSALKNITDCITDMYEEKCKALSKTKRDSLKKNATSRVKKDQNVFNCDTISVRTCGGKDNLNVCILLLFTLMLVVIFCEYM